MIRKIFTIVIPVLAITAAILLFGIKVYNDSIENFIYYNNRILQIYKRRTCIRNKTSFKKILYLEQKN